MQGLSYVTLKATINWASNLVDYWIGKFPQESSLEMSIVKTRNLTIIYVPEAIQLFGGYYKCAINNDFKLPTHF